MTSPNTIIADLQAEIEKLKRYDDEVKAELEAENKSLKDQAAFWKQSSKTWADQYEALAESFQCHPNRPVIEQLKAELRKISEAIDDPAINLTKTAVECINDLKQTAKTWINPNDKTQKQYLPHIGEQVLFCHKGKTYIGKHTGGSFKAMTPPFAHFGTWDCHWMYPPTAKEK